MRNRKSGISFLIMAVLFMNTVVFAEAEKSKLRWEYKYDNNDRLFYKTKKKFYRPRFEFKGLTAGEKREEADVIFELQITKDSEESKIKIACGDINLNKKKYDFLENSGRYEMDKAGNVLGMNALPIFLLSQPQFSESGLDMWNKEINLFKGDPKIIIGYYRVLDHESIVRGRKCVVVETEVGQVEDGTDAEKGIYNAIGAGKGRIKIKAKTWFDPEDGKIIRMETKKDHGKVSYDVVYELLDEKELRKLDGIEDDWELILPGVNNFQLTKDGKIVYVKQEVTRAPSHQSPVSENSKQTQNSELKTQNFIYICDGDGSNQRKLTEGTNPVVSPDGKWVAYVKNGNELWVTATDKQIDRQISKDIEPHIDWSFNSEKFAFFVITSDSENKSRIYKSVLKIYDLNTKEIKEIQIDGLTARVAWLSNNSSFIYPVYPANRPAFGEYKYFLYDLKENKSKEIEEFSKIGLRDLGQWLPKSLIYFVSKDYVPMLIYFSPEYEILKTEVIKNEGVLGIFRWKDDGNILFSGNGKILLYDVNEQKILWRKDFNFSLPNRSVPALSNDLKWGYFKKGGNLTKRQNIYRIPAPKEISKIVESD